VSDVHEASNIDLNDTDDLYHLESG